MYLTILMPCLNEERTIGICIEKAKKFVEKNNIEAEILIADNGSTDDSKNIAMQLGARVIDVAKKGYGNALRKGTEYAYGKYVIMGDCDDSYNFLELDEFIKKLEEGYDLVVGNRYGGTMEKGAMKLRNKYIGTPIISYLARRKYKVDIYDFNCGLRAYNNEKMLSLNCEAEGMEYASEMIIKAKQANLKIGEVKINFYKDGRQKRSHLRAVRDGIRHLRVILNKK